MRPFLPFWFGQLIRIPGEAGKLRTPFKHYRSPASHVHRSTEGSATPLPDSTKSLPRLIMYHELRGSWLLWHSNHAVWTPLDFLVGRCWCIHRRDLVLFASWGRFCWRLERQAPRCDNIFFLNTQQILVNVSRGGLARFLGAAAIAQSSHGAAPKPHSPLRLNLEARRDAVCHCPGHVWSPAHFWCVAPCFLVHHFFFISNASQIYYNQDS